MALRSLAVVCALTAVAGGCSSGDDDNGGAGGTGGNGGSTSDCKPTAEVCYVAGEDGPGSECLAKADHSASPTTQLRISQHQVAKPATLAKPFMQDAIITKKSALSQPACNQFGLAQFNLLMQIDSTQKTLTLGGGVPQKLIGDPNDGTCWADFVDPTSGLAVKPVSAPYVETADGALQAAIADFVMPIYLDDTTSSAVLVPLHEMTVIAKLSADKNCIGRYAHETLGENCTAAQDQFAWENGGRYEGYITVEEADDVMVVSLGQTLCVVLSGDPAKWKGPENSCKSAPAFALQGLPKGDWCKATNSEGGCQDAWYLSIEIAAAAIAIKGSWDDATASCK
jgi:hypothetical protein